VLKAIWTSDNVSFSGRHFSARGITAHPRPVTDPHPPIWIGGNSSQARQRVADRGQGWCPFLASPGLAQTARTVALDSPERLALAIDDLRRRLDSAGRDPASIDIAFANPAGGNPAADSFDADAHLAGLDRSPHWASPGSRSVFPATVWDTYERPSNATVSSSSHMPD
jgi:hypothetical protein